MDLPKIEIPALRADGTTQRILVPAGERAGVLIVDDTPAKLVSLAAIVSGMELEIVTATSGEQALRRLLKRDFALILLDVNMPTMDGFETAKLIRSRPRSEYTPIIFVTAEANSEAERFRGYIRGAVDFICSPIIPEILRAKVRVFVDLFYLQRQLLLHTEELKARQQELANSNQALNGLYRIAEGLNRAVSEREVAEAALERALELPGVQAGWIILREGESGSRLVATRNLPPALASPGALEGDCLCRRQLLTGELNAVTNILECEHLGKAKGDTPELRYHASVPLQLGDRTLGVMNLTGPQEDMFKEEKLKVLQSVGQQVAEALERARLHEHLESLVEQRTAALTAEIAERKRAEETVRNQARQQAAVAELGSVALGRGAVAALLDAAVTLVTGTLGVEYCKVLELLPDGQALRLRAGVGWRPGSVGTATEAAGTESMAGYALLSGGPVVAEDLGSETRFHVPALLRDHGIVSGLTVVIGGHERPFGVLGAHTAQRRSFTSDDVYFLQTTANILATAIDHRQTELARAQLVAILEASPDFVGTADTDGRMLYMNHAGRRMLGISPAEDISSLMVSDLYPERERSSLLSEVIPTILRQGSWAGESVFRARDGREIPVAVEGVAHRPTADSPPFMSAVVRDLTEYKKLEQQFRQVQKMEAIGQLAGGVAHDFNNILTAITGYTELMLLDSEATDPRREALEEIRKAAERATGLTSQLLAFSRQQVLELRVLDLNDVVAGMDKMLRRILGEDVELAASLAAGLGYVRADAGQLEQVLLNLAVNARDAMPTGGRLTIETANVELDDAYARDHVTVVPGRYVMLAVSDTGAGMDAETKAKIFDPFFTTKGVGKGTGLGLALVYGIVKQSGGHLWVYSEPGQGATFKVYLPRVDTPVDAAAPGPARRRPRRGSETILVVEDDESIRRLVRTVLQGHGYTVLEAAGPAEAVALVERHSGDIALLVTDVVMPGMSSREMAARIEVARPGLRVLYMSGYTDDAVVKHGVLGGQMAFLQKPFTPASLLHKVREVLDGD